MKSNQETITKLEPISLTIIQKATTMEFHNEIIMQEALSCLCILVHYSP